MNKPQGPERHHAGAPVDSFLPASVSSGDERAEAMNIRSVPLRSALRTADQRSVQRSIKSGRPYDIGYKGGHPTVAKVTHVTRLPQATGLPTANARAGLTQRRYISTRSAVQTNMPSSGGQVSGMAGHQRGRDWAGCGSPSTSRRATTRRPGGKPGKFGLWLGRRLPPGHRVVGLRQVDGMPHEPPPYKIVGDPV
jgi:hypothetical protein